MAIIESPDCIMLGNLESSAGVHIARELCMPPVALRAPRRTATEIELLGWSAILIACLVLPSAAI